MNVTRNIKKGLHGALLLTACVATLFGTTACTGIMDGENLEACPTGDFTVQFVYDYNIQRADMFRDHVGEVTLYVFDEAGNLVSQRHVTDRKALSDRNNRFNITLRAANTPGAADLVAGRSYRFVAVAGQKADAILPTSDALPMSFTDEPLSFYRQTAMTPGMNVSDLYLALDRAQEADTQGRYLVGNQLPLDTLWHTLGALACGVDNTNQQGWTNDTLVRIRPNITDSINIVKNLPQDTLTLSLIRNTNHLHISMHELDAPGNVRAEDYSVYIEDANGHMDWQNNILADQPLIYRPYAQRDEDMTDAGVAGITAHWDMMFNRIIFHDDAHDDAKLYIVRKSDKNTVAKLSLPRVLAYSRIAQDYYNLTSQGYLDREYNYNLSFYLKNGKWESTRVWINTEINILSWNVRAQEVNLGEDLNTPNQ